jgi:hypothetical protein
LTVLVKVLADSITVVVPVPGEQGTVTGSPTTACEAEKVQLVALVTCADRVTGPPEEPSDVGTALKEATTGGGVAAITTIRLLEAEAAPSWALTVTLYFTGFAVGLLGRLTAVEAEPVVQGNEAGSPASAGVTENTQVVALVTEALRVTDPPAATSGFGVAVSDLTAGLMAFAAEAGDDSAVADSTDKATTQIERIARHTDRVIHPPFSSPLETSPPLLRGSANDRRFRVPRVEAPTQSQGDRPN